MFGHLHSNWNLVTDRFDTIIVDEAQDLSPAWITMLRQILDPGGPRRMLLVADTSQEIYRRGFDEPSAEDGWTRCELSNNCRNTHGIATIIRRHFDGPIAPIAGPESEAVTWMPADDETAAIAEVGEAIDEILDERDHQPGTMLVTTTTGAVRDDLIDEYGFTRWEDSTETTVMCENVHRVKGLEFDHVILVVPDPDTADDLLYVGVSRAVISLTVIGPTAIADRLGLTRRS
jgi:superfamily I DNA/RNA helicase